MNLKGAGMDTKDIATIRDLEDRILDPTVRRSRETVSGILADEFREIGASGRLYDKAAIVDSLASAHLNGPTDRQIIHDFSARLIAPQVALALYRIVRHSASDGRETHSLRSSTWKVIDGRWQMIFHQGTPCPAP